MIVLGISLDEVVGEKRKLARRHHVPFGRQPRRVHEMRLRQPDLLGVFVHLLGEGVLGAGDALGEDDAGIVA